MDLKRQGKFGLDSGALVFNATFLGLFFPEYFDFRNHRDTIDLGSSVCKTCCIRSVGFFEEIAVPQWSQVCEGVQALTI